jgi:hypothetical protein
METIVEQLKDNFEKIEWMGTQRRHLQVTVAGRALDFVFDIRQRQTKLGTVYDVECIGNSSETTAVTRCLAKRKAPGNIRYLLVCKIMPNEGSRMLNGLNRKCFRPTKLSEQNHAPNVASI